MMARVQPEKVNAADEIVRRVGAYFAARPEFRLVLVYGSAANGNLRPSSDVDVAVAGERVLAPDVMLDTITGLSVALDRDVDLIDLNRVEGLIFHEALTNGRRVKLDRVLFGRLYAKALGWKEDFLPLQRKMRAARIERFVHGR